MAIDAAYPTAKTSAQFAANLADVRRNIEAAAAHVGRDHGAVRLLPVSKTVPEERLRLAVAAGATQLGENTVQEAARKAENMADMPELTWAIVGNLQTNKAKHVARFASEFHALDRMRVAEMLQHRLEIEDRTLDVFVQVNTSQEQSKFGLEPENAEAFIAGLAAFDRLRISGFMTLAVFSADETRVRSCFELLRQVRDRVCETAPSGIRPEELSMGMSGDYGVAIEEGATVVRVGQAIFGSRDVPDSDYWPDSSGAHGV